MPALIPPAISVRGTSTVAPIVLPTYSMNCRATNACAFLDISKQIAHANLATLEVLAALTAPTMMEPRGPCLTTAPYSTAFSATTPKTTSSLDNSAPSALSATAFSARI